MSFACNAWDGCWSDEQSDEVAGWLQGECNQESGASQTVPSERLRAAAEIVTKSLEKCVRLECPLLWRFER